MKEVDLSLVVVMHEMKAEVARTLTSLSTSYQRSPGCKYEVILVDNGSSEPMTEAELAHRDGVSYHYLDTDAVSPAAAVNFGVAEARGRYVGIIVDGARISSPGILFYAYRALESFERPVVTALSWHLGPAVHRVAVEEHGYSKERQTELLERAGWTSNGYSLFGISSISGSSAGGWFLPKSESSSLFLEKELFFAKGGFDERFNESGGGLVNHEFYFRLCSDPELSLAMILGEGTFHQMHGGAMTGADAATARKLWEDWRATYERIVGSSPRVVKRPTELVGRIRPSTLRWLEYSVQRAIAASERSRQAP